MKVPYFLNLLPLIYCLICLVSIQGSRNYFVEFLTDLTIAIWSVLSCGVFSLFIYFLSLSFFLSCYVFVYLQQNFLLYLLADISSFCNLHLLNVNYTCTLTKGKSELKRHLCKFHHFMECIFYRGNTRNFHSYWKF